MSESLEKGQRTYTQADLDAEISAERERCALLAIEAASEAVKMYKDDPGPVRQPYANNRMMHVGWAAADLIRKP